MESGTPSRDTAWAVSQENVEVVFAAFRRFEADDMTGFGALLDPGIVATAAGWPEPGPWIGADALVTQLERIERGGRSIAWPMWRCWPNGANGS